MGKYTRTAVGGSAVMKAIGYVEGENRRGQWKQKGEHKNWAGRYFRK